MVGHLRMRAYTSEDSRYHGLIFAVQQVPIPIEGQFLVAVDTLPCQRKAKPHLLIVCGLWYT